MVVPRRTASILAVSLSILSSTLWVYLFLAETPAQTSYLPNVKGCVVTIDAAGCQQDIAKRIRGKKADYVLA
jgi:hypothetical protein